MKPKAEVLEKGAQTPLRSQNHTRILLDVLIDAEQVPRWEHWEIALSIA